MFTCTVRATKIHFYVTFADIQIALRCTRLATASNKVYPLLAYGRWFSPGTPASSITKTDRHDIAEILLKVALNIKYKKNQIALKRKKSTVYFKRRKCASSMYCDYIFIKHLKACCFP